jgi:mono/diheme cytochrome c family protein
MNELDAWEKTARRAAQLAHKRGWLEPRVLVPVWMLGVLVWIGVIGAGLQVYTALQRDVPETFLYADEHFMYGSIGSEAEGGVPYWIWVVLPRLFPQHLPDQPGEGYARLGFVFDTNRQSRPIGTSIRDRPIPMIALNCAGCHVGTIQDAPDAPARYVLGMPSHQFNFEGYLRFLIACGQDERFNADTLIPAIEQVNPNFSFLDKLLYRFVVIPRTRQALLERGVNFSWMNSRPHWGPGRVDTFGPYKVRFGFDLNNDDTSVGTVDLPSLWNQRVRRRMWLHWDGNNNAVEERNISAALGAGASADSLDTVGLQRVVDWIWDVQPPDFPRERIDAARVPAGQAIYQARCAECHALDGARVGQVVPIGEIGTDRERLDSFTPALTERMNTLGTGKPWRFRHFRKTDGYANQPLDGLWLRAPYLHNGSVPTMRDLLKPPDQRPVVFYRGGSVYDYANLGFVSQGEQAERRGFRFDTRERGNGNQGHTYGTDLSPEEIESLLAYLKTL